MTTKHAVTQEMYEAGLRYLNVKGNGWCVTDLYLAMEEERCQPQTPEGRETNEQFSEREAKIIMDSADAQCFRWLLKHHSGTGKAIGGTGMRCWIGGVEFNGEDVRDAIDAAMERK